jgi:hypothetical protein
MSSQSRTVITAGTVSTATGQSTTQTVPDTNPDPRYLTVVVDVTAVTAATLKPEIQWSDNGVEYYSAEPLATPTDAWSANITAVSRTCKQVTVKANYWRLFWPAPGTSVTWGAKYIYTS